MEENSKSLPSPCGSFECFSKLAKNEWIEMEENSEDDIREIADNVKEIKMMMMSHGILFGNLLKKLKMIEILTH